MKKLILLSLVILSVSMCFAQQNALHFDGTNDKMDAGNSTQVQITGTHITLEAWVNPTSFASQIWENNIINKEAFNSSQGYMLRCGASGKVNFNFGNGFWNELNTSTAVLSLNTWTHIAATYDGSYARIYINGIITDSVAKSASIQNPTGKNLTIGACAEGGRFFSGALDEVRVWNITRTKADIQANMNNEICGGQPGLVAYFRFNQGIAGGNNAGLTSATNQVPNGLSGTLSNFALNGTSSNWIAGDSLTPAFNVNGDTIYHSICQGETFNFGGQNYTTQGSYIATLMTSNGCDSIIPIELTVNPSYNLTIVDTICQGTTYFLGAQQIFQSGTYNASLQTQAGCDSIIALDLHVKPLNLSLSVINGGTTIQALSTTGTFQWYNCNTHAIIAGETNDMFSPTANGSYACIVTEGDCTDTTFCIPMLVGLNELDVESEINIYPNPGNGLFHIQLKNIQKAYQIEISDALGRKISLIEKSNEENYLLDLSNQPKGVYFIQLIFDNQQLVRKLIKY